MFSIKYFEEAFYDKSKLNQFLIEIKEDFIRFEKELITSINKGDFIEMRRELHKMETIVTQIKFNRLLELFEEYRGANEVPEKTKSLNTKLSALLKEFHVEINKYIA